MATFKWTESTYAQNDLQNQNIYGKSFNEQFRFAIMQVTDQTYFTKLPGTRNNNNNNNNILQITNLLSFLENCKNPFYTKINITNQNFKVHQHLLKSQIIYCHGYVH